MNEIAAIDLDHVTFGWPRGNRVIDIGRFTAARGERVFLSGPSGGGKSTLLGLIGGVLEPDGGTVDILGEDLGRLSAGRRDSFRATHIGFIFQIFNLVPYLSVVENVLLSARFSGERRARIGDPKAEAVRLLAALGLGDSDLLARPVTELSIGQQQRVAAARALLGMPELLIADEPTSALDFDTRETFLKLILRECRAVDATLVFVSHDTSLGRHFDRTVSLAEINRATPVAAL